MNRPAVAFLSAAGLTISLAGAGAGAQATTPDAIESHVARARAAAGEYHPGLFNSLCSQNSLQPAAAPARGQRAGAAPAQPGPPPESAWHAEPVKVFDNLYFVGMTEYSAWAVKTSEGVIIVDA